MPTLRNRIDGSDYEIVRNAPMFRTLEADCMDHLIATSTVKSFERGSILFLQGEPADAFYIVLEGWLKVFRMRETGEEFVIEIFSRAESVAEAAVFASGEYPASCEAVDNCRVLRIPGDRLLQLIRETPEVGIAMLASTSRHLHTLVREIEEIRGMSSTQRVAQFLLSLGMPRNGSMVVRMPFEKNLIANRLAMTPYSLSRAFSRLKDFGVKVDQSKALISNVAALRALVAQDARERD